jgi:hypothetical protein
MNFSKITKVALPVLVALTMAASCGGKSSMTDQEVVDAVAATGSLVTNNSGDVFSDHDITYHISDGDFIYVTTYVNYQDKYQKDDAGNPVVKKVLISNAMDDTSKSKWNYNGRVKNDKGELLDYKGKFTLAGEFTAAFDSVLTAVVTYGSATASISWKINYTPIEYQQINLENVRGGSVIAGKYIDTVGYITGGFTKGDIYAGAYIASGEQALMLYAGNLESLWNSLALKAGDLVRVKAQYAPYNGLTEIKPTTIVKLSEVPAGFEVHDPVKINITDGSQWALLAGQDSRVTICNGLTYAGLDEGEKLNIGSHWNVYFTLGSTKITVRVNYHIGSGEQTTLKTMINGWTIGTSKVNFVDGVLSWYNGPQLQPVLASNIVAA